MCAAIACTRWEALPVRLAQHHARIRVLQFDHARRDHRARGIHHAGDRPLRPDRAPQRIVRIDLRQPAAFQRTADTVEVEPRNAVHHERDRRVRLEQRADAGGDRGQRRRLHRHQHGILRPERLRVVAGLHARVQLALAGVHRQPVVLDRRQMRPARQHRHLRPAAREAHREMAADRTGAIHADPHSSLHCPLPRVWRVPHPGVNRGCVALFHDDLAHHPVPVVVGAGQPERARPASAPDTRRRPVPAAPRPPAPHSPKRAGSRTRASARNSGAVNSCRSLPRFSRCSRYGTPCRKLSRSGTNWSSTISRLNASAFDQSTPGCACADAAASSAATATRNRRHGQPETVGNPTCWRMSLTICSTRWRYGQVLHAELLHQAGVVDQVVARGRLAAGLVLEADARVGQELAHHVGDLAQADRDAAGVVDRVLRLVGRAARG